MGYLVRRCLAPLLVFGVVCSSVYANGQRSDSSAPKADSVAIVIMHVHRHSDSTTVRAAATDVRGCPVPEKLDTFIVMQPHSRLPAWLTTLPAMVDLPSRVDSIRVSSSSADRVQPAAVGLVLDVSPSMTNPRAVRVQRAVDAVLRSVRDEDAVTIVKFTARVDVEVPYTSDKQQARDRFKVNGVDRKYDGTAMYDAMIETMRQLRRAPLMMHQSIVLFTDGSDNASHASVDSVLRLAVESGTTLHAIVYGQSVVRELETLARQTGGSVHYVTNIYDVERLFMASYVGTYAFVDIRLWHTTPDAGAAIGMKPATAVGSNAVSIGRRLPAALQRHRLSTAGDAPELALRIPGLSWCSVPDAATLQRSFPPLHAFLAESPDVAVELLRPTAVSCSPSIVRKVFQRIRADLEEQTIAPSRILFGATVTERLGGEAPIPEDAVIMVLFQP